MQRWCRGGRRLLFRFLSLSRRLGFLSLLGFGGALSLFRRNRFRRLFGRFSGLSRSLSLHLLRRGRDFGLSRSFGFHLLRRGRVFGFLGPLRLRLCRRGGVQVVLLEARGESCLLYTSPSPRD